MVDLLDVLTNQESFNLLTNDNALGVMMNVHGQVILKDTGAVEVLKDNIGKDALTDINVVKALQHQSFVDVVKKPAFAQQNNFKVITEFVEKERPDDKLPYALQSVISGNFMPPKTSYLK